MLELSQDFSRACEHRFVGRSFEERFSLGGVARGAARGVAGPVGEKQIGQHVARIFGDGPDRAALTVIGKDTKRQERWCSGARVLGWAFGPTFVPRHDMDCGAVRHSLMHLLHLFLRRPVVLVQIEAPARVMRGTA
jgi:hypothetical protein